MRPRLLSDQPVLLGQRRKQDGTVEVFREPINDVEMFIRRLLDRGLERMGSGMFITDEEYEDAVFELLQHALKLEQRFDPERNPSFVGYATYILRRRVVDVAPRRLLGRTGLRIAERSHEELDERAATGPRPWQTVPPEQGDPDQDRGASQRRLPGERARATAWADTVLGL